MKYKVIYKCRLCKKVIVASIIELDSPEEGINKILAYQNMTSNPYMNIPSIHLVHTCTSTKCGVAEFIGLELY